jgi:hypothetical protein
VPAASQILGIPVVPLLDSAQARDRLRSERKRLCQNILSYGNERYQTELAIKGDKMTGTRQGGAVPWQISLQRKK